MCVFSEAECLIHPCSDHRTSSSLSFSLLFCFTHRSFVNASQAASQRLAFVNPVGNAIMKVDNTTTIPLGSKRDTVRIESKDRFAVGSVWIADMLHVPFGVGNTYQISERRFSRSPCLFSIC